MALAAGASQGQIIVTTEETREQQKGGRERAGLTTAACSERSVEVEGVRGGSVPGRGVTRPEIITSNQRKGAEEVESS